MSLGALPTALRKCLVDKFQAFDEYQLAKYNKGTKSQTKHITVVTSMYDFLVSNLYFIKADQKYIFVNNNYLASVFYSSPEILFTHCIHA